MRTNRARAIWSLLVGLCLVALVGVLSAQQMVTDTRDPKQAQDEEFAKAYKEWTGASTYGSPLVDHLPLVKGIPTPKDVLGYYIGAPRKLTYYADILKFYRSLAAATPRVRVETIGKSDEGRELVVVWVSSEQNMRTLQQNRDNLAKIADPRGLSETQVRQLVATTKPNYHLIGGLHSTESGPSEMLMELVYRLATETSPLITQIRNNVYVSVTPVADADGRDRAVDWFYHTLEEQDKADVKAKTAPASSPSGGGASSAPTTAQATSPSRTAVSVGAVPYWGKYVYHDNNRDINIALMQVRALTDWYFTAHPPILHDLHESMSLMYTYSGGPPQNPNLDPLLFAELPWFAEWEVAQMTKWGMPGVYTYGFMDGWSPGYLGSVVYNHNGVMRMYETQSGRDPGTPAPAGRGDSPSDAAQTQTPATTAGGGGGRPSTSLGAGPVNSGGPVARGGPAPLPTGRGGNQPREWYRGIPVPPNAAASFTRRDNTNYMETAILSSLQLTASFPNVVVENFYVKSRNSIDEGKTKAPYGYVIPLQRDMTRVAELLRILRIQRIEIGQATSEFKIGDAKYAAGSYVIKRDQPYGRLAKNLLEKQVYPDPRLTTYDDSGWTMGLQMLVDVKEIGDAAILKVATTPVDEVSIKGKIAGPGTVAVAVAHYGSNNMIALRYRLKSAQMKIAEKAFTAEGIDFPAGSFIITGGFSADMRPAIEELGLTAAGLKSIPDVPTHDCVVPRIAIYSQWTSTQDLGWYRLTFDRFGIPYDLIYKEQVKKGDLRSKYDVIVMAAQNINRQTVLQKPASTPQPYQKSDKYKFLGMYGETPDMSGGFGQEGVQAFAKFLEGGGTLVAAAAASRFPIEFGFTHTVDAEPIIDVTAPRPIVQAEIARPEHPVFYGYTEKTIPIKYIGGSTLRVGVADQGNILARYVGGDSSVLSGLLAGGDVLRQKPFAVDIPSAYNGKGRVIVFTSNPVYRWQNHGEFNMMFNSILNWNYVPPATGM